MPPTEVQNTQNVSDELLALLVCPKTKGKLVYNPDTNELISEAAGLAFPITDGVPILLIDEARTIDEPPPVTNLIDEPN